MKAFCITAYGPIDSMHEIELPLPAPGAGEVRVRVLASAINPADYRVIEGTFKFLHGRRMPLVPGYDFSGTVDAVGPGGGFAPGDEVFGFLPYSPTNARGAFAEYLLARTSEIARKPPGVSHLTAATAATPGLTALRRSAIWGGSSRAGAR